MKQSKSTSDIIFGLMTFAVILALGYVIMQISQKITHSNTDEPVRSVSAQPYKNHSDYSKLNDTTISEYFSDSKWYELSVNEESNQPNQTQTEDNRTIRQTTYGRGDGGGFVRLVSGAQVENHTTETSQCLYAQSNLLPDYTISLDGSPQVLIIHTHTTEGFELSETDYYDATQNARTTDDNSNVIAVGNEIATRLEASGIGVIHDTTYHDYPSYTGCYSRSAQTTKSILSQYPTIKVVLDIHRDSITTLDGTRIAPVIEIEKQKAAQARIISCCDDGTMDMPEYMQNFRLACLIQNETEYTYPGLMRAIEFDYNKYNQDITTGSLTIEVGSAANSLDQAIYTGQLLGNTIAQALLSIST